jgi:hypothetical protein
LAVDNLNKFLKNFSDNASGISRSISNLSDQLGQSARAFNAVALGTGEARTAAVNYLEATRNLNAGLRERAALLAEVAENERVAKLAGAGIRETTQFAGPIGPGPASAIDAPVRGGVSEVVASTIDPSRGVAIQKDQLALDKALLNLKERKADAVFEELKNSEALVRSANEAKLIAAEARGERPSSQLKLLSPEQQLRQEGIERAEQVAQNAALKSKKNQEEFAAQKKYAQQIFNIEQEFNRKLRNQEIDTIMDKIKLESRLQEELFEKAMALDEEEGRRHDKEFRRREKVKEDSFKRSRIIAESVAQSNPIGGAENIPGSPAFLKARSKRRREAASNALIGGAFPLLFGQGIGAAAGGAIGGGAGGLLGGQFGFGLSLVGTAAGTAIDALVAKAAELGKALDPVSGNVDTIIQSLGLANTATGSYIKRLEEVAGKQVALEEATKQLALVVGDEGVQALREFGEASTELGKAVSRFVTLALAEAAKLLKGPVQNVASGLTSLSLRAQATRSTDPRQQELVRQASSTQSIEEQARLFKEIEALQRQINEEAEKEVEARLNLLSPTNQLLASEERKFRIAELNGDILNDQVLSLEKQEITSQYNIANQKVLKDLAQKKIKYQESVNMLKANELIMERGLLGLTQQRNKAEEAAAEKARRAMDRRMREFKRLQEEQRRADEQRKKQLDAAVIAELNSVNKLMSVDLQRVKVQDGEMAALKLRQNQIEQELKNKLKILNVQYLQQVQNLKSVEEAKKLYEAYLNQDRALRRQSEIEEVLVINAEKRLTLAREQQVLDENRARRGQLEGVQQEGSRFSMQLDDPFNLNPERLRAFETEIRTAQILRTEREKLADLEREGRALKVTESAENVKLLAEQIDRQRAFIPALEAELALRNELEAAAFRQAEIVQKYGFLANELSTAMTSAVQAVVTGTGTVEEAFSTMFANIGKAFIDMATQMLAQKLFMTVLSALNPGGVNPSGAFNIGLAAGRASGGPVSPGSTYLVGERGPELLTMTPSGGYVTNNSASQAAMDRYSGGNTRGGAISVNYNVTEINGMKFVTEDQFRAGISQAAKRQGWLICQRVFILVFHLSRCNQKPQRR